MRMFRVADRGEELLRDEIQGSSQQYETCGGTKSAAQILKMSDKNGDWK